LEHRDGKLSGKKNASDRTKWNDEFIPLACSIYASILEDFNLVPLRFHQDVWTFLSIARFPFTMLLAVHSPKSHSQQVHAQKWLDQV
jgi:hypothetical protein